MKSFKQKLSEQLESINISALQEPKRQYHLYADFVELVSIVNSAPPYPGGVTIDRDHENIQRQFLICGNHVLLQSGV